MGDVVIRAEGLGKQYHLGGAPERYTTLRDQIRKWTSLRMLLRRGHRAESRPLFWALKNVSFEVKRGEVVGIVGRNGAGKSTLLKILSRITEPTEGAVDIRGRVGSLLEVGTGFNPELTGRENIYLNGAILGMRRAEIQRKFDDIVQFAAVEAFLDTQVKHYSTGMYMRLAFAVAAHLEPEILVVDEVLAVGDVMFQKKCLGKIGDVARGGRTVLIVSHQMSMVETLCQRGILLDEGQVQMIGQVGEVVRRYLQAATARSKEFDLSQLRRTGSGEVRLTGFWVEDDAGRPVESVASGSPVVLAFRYTGAVGPTSRVSLGFSVHTPSDQTVTLVYSDYQGVCFSDLPPAGVIRFTIPRLPFSHGLYFVGAKVLVNGGEADFPRGFIGRLDVDAGDYYGAGQPFHSGIGPMLLDGHWSPPTK